MSPSPAAQAHVRMYRHGLGDCFLLRIPRPTGAPFRILIDCGVMLGTPDAKQTMTRVAEDIRQATGGWIDVLVATHQHWDHLSGFLQARTVFDDMRFGELWLAWTEDPFDELAADLRARRRQTERSLRAMASKAAALDGEISGHLKMLLGFFGTARGGQRTQDALDFLTDHRSRPRVRYLRPGGPTLPLADASGSRAYVLGPPRDPALLRRSRPTRTGSEVYDLSPATALLAGAGALAGADDVADRSHAFAPHLRLDMAEAEALPFFRDTYGRPGDPERGWRRIDRDWLASADQLALDLDSHTNNTSLALAFELGPGGGVLLFPGDAQVGNWQSWAKHTWFPDGPNGPSVTIAELLARTILYKVGHHASHNATLRAEGLERMTSPELVALIPVHERTAGTMGWAMPFPALLDRLVQQTRGRVLRADSGFPARPLETLDSVWRAFVGRVTEGPDHLYWDYTIPHVR